MKDVKNCWAEIDYKIKIIVFHLLCNYFLPKHILWRTFLSSDVYHVDTTL